MIIGQVITIKKESAIEKSIQKYLDSIGAYHIKNHGSIFSRAGTPDITACINGTFVGIEVKRPHVGRVSALQRAHIKLIQRAGGVAFVACSIEETKENLKKFNII